MIDLPKRLSIEIKSRGFTVAKLVRATGLSRATVDRVLRGEVEPEQTTLKLIAQALGLGYDPIHGRIYFEELSPLAPSIIAELQRRADLRRMTLAEFIGFLVGLDDRERKPFTSGQATDVSTLGPAAADDPSPPSPPPVRTDKETPRGRHRTRTK